MSQPRERACSYPSYSVSRADLPLSCPLPRLRLWDAHPRVYLPIEKTGKAVCPYCNTEYTLADFGVEIEE